MIDEEDSSEFIIEAVVYVEDNRIIINFICVLSDIARRWCL